MRVNLFPSDYLTLQLCAFTQAKVHPDALEIREALLQTLLMPCFESSISRLTQAGYLKENTETPKPTALGWRKDKQLRLPYLTYIREEERALESLNSPDLKETAGRLMFEICRRSANSEIFRENLGRDTVFLDQWNCLADTLDTAVNSVAQEVV